MGNRSLAGKPIMCLVPSADSGRLRALTGDPAEVSTIVEASPSDVAKVCAVLLLGLSPADRRTALRQATGLAQGPRRSVVPVHALLPDDATVPQLVSAWNGLMLLLLALGSSSADTSVGTVVANAASMASGVPFASDPLVGERQNEVLLAKAILEAALLDDATAKKWFEDNKLSDALQAIVLTSQGGSSDDDPTPVDAVERVVDNEP